MRMIEYVLFDLDGTLADTALDLGAALNRVRQEEGLEPIPLAQTRPVTSQGVRALLRVGFDLRPEDDAYQSMNQRVLAHYAAGICKDTRLFDGIEALLGELDARHIKWGIVTNKHTRFTTPLIAALGLDQRAAVIVSGDTVARAKPFPDPLLHACETAGIPSENSVYIGDDQRDIQAGRAANMATIAAAWGYIGQNEAIETWGANVTVSQPSFLLKALENLGLR